MPREGYCPATRTDLRLVMHRGAPAPAVISPMRWPSRSLPRPVPSANLKEVRSADRNKLSTASSDVAIHTNRSG